MILISTFLHAVAFFAGSYYLPLYFQVLGASATDAGIRYVLALLSRVLSYNLTGWWAALDSVLQSMFKLTIVNHSCLTRLEVQCYQHWEAVSPISN